MADDGAERAAGAERSGPPTWVVVAATLAVAAVLAAGVAGWLTWRASKDEDAAASTVPPTTAPPDEGTLVEGEEGAQTLFRRVTATGIEVRAQLVDFGAPQQIFSEGEPAPLSDEGEAAATTTGVVESPGTPGTTSALPEAAPETVGTVGTIAAPTASTAPTEDPYDTNGNAVLDLCEPTGDLSGWAISDDAILQGSTPWVAGRLDELYPSLMWTPNGELSIVGIVVQVGDDVTNVSLRGPDGALDEMAPVRGAAVLAIPLSDEDANAVVFGPDFGQDITIAAQRADGTTTRVPPNRLQEGPPAWNGTQCTDGAQVTVTLPPDPSVALPEPGAEQPADPAAAEGAIRTALDTVYGPDTGAEQRLAYVDDPAGLDEVLDAIGGGDFADEAAAAAVDVSEIVFVSASEAAFLYTLDTPGIVWGEQLGRARLLDGTWKITRGTWCQDLQKANAICPP